MSEYKRPTIHYTQFTDLPPDDVHYHEWKAYRRELPRLLAEGRGGQYALLKGDQVVGVFDTDAEAEDAGEDRFGLDAVFLIQLIREWEPLLRVPRCHW